MLLHFNNVFSFSASAANILASSNSRAVVVAVAAASVVKCMQRP